MMDLNNMLARNLLLLVSMLLLLTGKAEELHGRHVCSQEKIIAEPVPTQQSYIRAVYRKDLQRTIYQTAYKTMFKMQIRTGNVSGCCPGWEKKSPRDPNCMKPVCDEGCENGGQCVGPDLCVCNEGYTGHTCHIDIDECSGRNTCQQKCTNLLGSYECSCQEGFKLSEDEYTCDLCLSCTEEFQNLYAQIETIQSIKQQGDGLREIHERLDNFSLVIRQTDEIHNIQKQLDNLMEITIQTDGFQDLKQEVDTLKLIIEQADIEDLNNRINILQESSQYTDKFQEIQNQINELTEVKSLVETVQILNDTVQNLQQDDTQAKKLEEMQKQIEDIAIVKAQQDEAQTDRFEEMNKELEQLRGISGVSENVKSMKDLLDQIFNRVQELEEDKLDTLSEITVQAEKYQDLQSEVDILKNNIKKVDSITEMNTRIDNLQKTSVHTETFQELQNQVDDLAEVKSLVGTVHILNETILRLQNDDTQTTKLQEIQNQIEDLSVTKAQEEKAHGERFEEMQKQLEQLQEINVLSETVKGMKDLLEQMSKRIEELEADKATLKNSLSEAVTNYESAISALQSKEVTQEHVTTDIYEVNQNMPLDRLVSLSEQISILEERMADCACGQDYPRG